MASTSFGYWLVNGGSNGAGIVRATGAPGSSSNAVYLGTTSAAIQKNFAQAAASLNLQGLMEVNPSTAAAGAVKNGAAWYRQTPGNAVPTNDLTVTAAELASGGSLGLLFRGILSAADLTLGEVSDAPSSVVPAGGDTGETAPGAGDTGGDQTNETPPAEDPTPAPDSAPGVTDLAGLATLLKAVTSPATWIRVLEAIGGVLLLYLGLHALTGQSSSIGGQAQHIKTKIRVVPV